MTEELAPIDERLATFKLRPFHQEQSVTAGKAEVEHRNCTTFEILGP